MGGVLIELNGGPTFGAWAGSDVPSEEVWRRWLTSPSVRAFECGRSEPEDFADGLITEFVLPVNRQEFLDAFGSWSRGLAPGALDLVRRVDRRCLRATLSNTNVIHWPRVLREPGFEQLFHHHFPSHLTGRLKPDPDVFEHVVDALQCVPSEILFLDDQPLNVAAARKAGLTAVAVSGVGEAETALAEYRVLTEEAR